MTAAYQQIKVAWESTDRRGELNRTVERLAAVTSLDELDAALGQLLDEVRADGADDDTEEIINEVGDRLHGWCLEPNRIHAVRTEVDTESLSGQNGRGVATVAANPAHSTRP